MTKPANKVKIRFTPNRDLLLYSECCMRHCVKKWTSQMDYPQRFYIILFCILLQPRDRVIFMDFGQHRYAAVEQNISKIIPYDALDT